MRGLFSAAAAAALTVIVAGPAPAAETPDAGILKVRIIGSDMAAVIVDGAVRACREKGYQVGAVVVDRNGDIIVARRDTFASRHTLEIAQGKAGAVILSGLDSGQLKKNRPDIRPELDLLPGVLVMEGGLQIRAAGALIGAVGVSGAPGGDIDASCASAGIDLVRDKLDFAD